MTEVLLLHLTFVGGRPIDRRYRNVLQAKVNRKLPAVMDHVTDRKPYYFELAGFHEDVFTIPKRPILRKNIVVGISKARQSFLQSTIEEIDEVLSRFGVRHVIA